MMGTEEMLEKVQELKELAIRNGFKEPEETAVFFSKYWIQILDILDDALSAYLRKSN